MINCPSCNTPLTLTLASEPAKVAEPEFDRHGRKIIKREGHAMIVECDTDSYSATDDDGRFYFVCGEWLRGVTTGGRCLDSANAALLKAAATPLPIEKPAEGKVETNSDGIIATIVKRFEAIEARLAKVEGK